MNVATNPVVNTFEALVVEDDRFFQEVIKEGITQVIPNCSIDVCRTKQDALQHIQTEGLHYGIAIVDLGLPDGDGLAVIRELMRVSPSTPVMVVSVCAEERRVIEAIRAGAAGYVIKGDNMLSVTRAIDQLMNGIRPLSAKLAGSFLRLAGRETVPDNTLDPIKHLTPREMDLLRQFALGKSYQEAANAMQISLTTVQTHTRNLYRKLGVKSSLRALSKAKEQGLL